MEGHTALNAIHKIQSSIPNGIQPSISFSFVKACIKTVSPVESRIAGTIPNHCMQSNNKKPLKNTS
jgi:hypothetical protein